MEISILHCVVMLVVVAWFPVTLEFLEGQELHSFSVFAAPSIISTAHSVFCTDCGEAHWQWLSQRLEHSVQQITFRALQMQAFDSFAHSVIPALNLKTGIDIDT